MLARAFNILMEHGSCIHDMVLLLSVDLDVCIANKGEKIEHKFRGELCIALHVEHVLFRGCLHLSCALSSSFAFSASAFYLCVSAMLSHLPLSLRGRDIFGWLLG